MSRALVIGAGGFIGAPLCARLEAAGIQVDVVSRAAPRDRPGPDIALLEIEDRALAQACDQVDVVYYLAAVAHESVARADPVTLTAVNVDAPARWLRAADHAGVERFVWLSSIKVLGDVSAAPLTVDAPYRPGDAYACSKVRAERVLLSTPLNRTLLTVVRPPLVYGPGVAGNFLALLRWAVGGLPLPLKSAVAPRSLVGIANLCDLLLRLGSSGDGIYHVADAGDWSVARLMTEIRRCSGLPARLFSVPQPLLRLAARTAGRRAVYSRLFEPLQVDQSATLQDLGWNPPYSGIEQLEETVAWYRRAH